MKLVKIGIRTFRGAIAQLGERVVRNDEAVGSIPTSSTIVFKPLQPVCLCFVHSFGKYRTDGVSRLAGYHQNHSLE
jgi:hypothetical protein